MALFVEVEAATSVEVFDYGNPQTKIPWTWKSVAIRGATLIDIEGFSRTAFLADPSLVVLEFDQDCPVMAHI